MTGESLKQLLNKINVPAKLTIPFHIASFLITNLFFRSILSLCDIFGSFMLVAFNARIWRPCEILTIFLNNLIKLATVAFSMLFFQKEQLNSTIIAFRNKIPLKMENKMNIIFSSAYSLKLKNITLFLNRGLIFIFYKRSYSQRFNVAQHCGSLHWKWQRCFDIV